MGKRYNRYEMHDSVIRNKRLGPKFANRRDLKGYDALLFDHQDAKTADGNLIRTVDKNGQSMMS